MTGVQPAGNSLISADAVIGGVTFSGDVNAQIDIGLGIGILGKHQRSG
jgi:hypothetical protein